MRNKRLLGILLAISSAGPADGSCRDRVDRRAPARRRAARSSSSSQRDVDYTDPQLSYYGETWKLEQATACKLFNWPDKEGAAGAELNPEVAAGLPVISKDGKTYTFTIKPGFKFSNGKPVNAKSFADAINRLREPEDAVAPASSSSTSSRVPRP